MKIHEFFYLTCSRNMREQMSAYPGEYRDFLFNTKLTSDLVQ